MRGDRLHVAFFGRRNAGKSSLLNAFSNQPVAIVSATPGTTTDPVFKAMELLPLGPVVLIDTAGIDDRSDSLGRARKKKSADVLGRTDLAILVMDATQSDFAYEDDLISRFQKASLPYLIAANKADLGRSAETEQWLRDKPFVSVSALKGAGIEELRQRVLTISPREWEPSLLGELIRAGDLVLLVVPIDLGAPKGRLIMPQVKALREILDADAVAAVCKERELLSALSGFKRPPALVVTDSQVFAQAAAAVPEEIPLTSFSILSIRQKGDLARMVEGVRAVKNLKPGDRVLIAESCSHHPLEDDIGRVKIPRWLDQQVGGGLRYDTAPGCDYPEDLAEYKLVVHCGACTLNRREMLRRQELPSRLGVPMTNYGVLIAYLKGVFPRALRPFRELAHLLAEEKGGPDVALRKRMAKLIDT